MNTTTASSLPELRAAIDAVDDRIVALLGRRQRLVDRVAQLKQNAGQPVRDVGREAAILNRLQKAAHTAGLPPQLIARIYRIIFDAAIRLQTARRTSHPSS